MLRSEERGSQTPAADLGAQRFNDVESLINLAACFNKIVAARLRAGNVEERKCLAKWITQLLHNRQRLIEEIETLLRIMQFRVDIAYIG